MTSQPLTILDRQVVESVLQMGSGYVLDFSDRTFAEFFNDFGVNIDDERYHDQGRSKAKRLRSFLRQTDAALIGRVLNALMEHRRLKDPEDLNPTEAAHYDKLVANLLGGSTKTVDESDEARLLKRAFRPEEFKRLPLDAPTIQVLVDRMREAHSCIEAGAYLSTVILCGSVLEGMCLGYGSRNLEEVNRGYQVHFGRTAPQIPKWRLAEWIEVLGKLGRLTPNIAKFGHALREFRNYVHPAEQLARRFSPDRHTARISFYVVVAAAESLASSAQGGRNP